MNNTTTQSDSRDSGVHQQIRETAPRDTPGDRRFLLIVIGGAVGVLILVALVVVDSLVFRLIILVPAVPICIWLYVDVIMRLADRVMLWPWLIRVFTLSRKCENPLDIDRDPR